MSARSLRNATCIGLGLDESLLDRQGLSEGSLGLRRAAHGLVQLAEARIAASQIAPGLGERRVVGDELLLDRDRLPVRRHRILMPPGRTEQAPQAVEDAGESGAMGDDFRLLANQGFQDREGTAVQ